MSPPPSQPGRIHSCNYCRREFLNFQALGGHQNAHRKERAFKVHNMRRDCQCRSHQQMRAMRHQQQRNYSNSIMHMGPPPALGIPAYPPQPAFVLFLAPTPTPTPTPAPTPATTGSATTASTSDTTTTTTTVSADHYCPASLDLTLRL